MSEFLVAVDLLRQFAQILGDALAVEVALHDFAVSGFTDGIAGSMAVVNGECGVVEIALRLKAGLVDELFVFRLAVLGWFLAAIGK